MMRLLLCAIFVFWTQCLSIPLDLIPEDDKCTGIACPKLNCTNTIKKEGECCMSCITVDLIPEDDKCAQVNCPKLNCTIKKKEECCMICDGCVHEGAYYNELTIVPINKSDPCEACFCHNGKITCGNISESCPQLKCDKTKQIKEPKMCCPRCITENPISLIQGSCQQNGIIYKENDTWNPYYIQFGIVKCINCTCKNGTAVCKKLSCPPVRACTPEDPEEEEVYCCPKCNRTLKTNGSISHLAPTLDPSAPPESNTTCTVVYSHKVYETVNIEVDQVAIENITSSLVHIHVWVPELRSAYTETYSSENFMNYFINTRFKLIGNTTTELVKTFYEWLEIKDKEQSIAYCTANCSTQVLNLLLQPCN